MAHRAAESQQWQSRDEDILAASNGIQSQQQRGGDGAVRRMVSNDPPARVMSDQSCILAVEYGDMYPPNQTEYASQADYHDDDDYSLVSDQSENQAAQESSENTIAMVDYTDDDTANVTMEAPIVPADAPAVEPRPTSPPPFHHHRHDLHTTLHDASTTVSTTSDTAAATAASTDEDALVVDASRRLPVVALPTQLPATSNPRLVATTAAAAARNPDQFIGPGYKDQVRSVARVVLATASTVTAATTTTGATTSNDASASTSAAIAAANKDNGTHDDEDTKSCSHADLEAQPLSAAQLAVVAFAAAPRRSVHQSDEPLSTASSPAASDDSGDPTAVPVTSMHRTSSTAAAVTVTAVVMEVPAAHNHANTRTRTTPPPPPPPPPLRPTAVSRSNSEDEALARVAKFVQDEQRAMAQQQQQQQRQQQRRRRIRCRATSVLAVVLAGGGTVVALWLLGLLPW
jgi:hypothetical protein